MPAERDAFANLACAKRFCCAENVDGFKPVGLALSVVAVEDVETRAELREAFEVTKT